MNILCVDTEPETIEIIKASGYSVEHGDIGFRSGHPNLPYPPHEFDLIICDLRQPACYDATYWGPGKNSNIKCKIEKEIEIVINEAVEFAKNSDYPSWELMTQLLYV